MMEESGTTLFYFMEILKCFGEITKINKYLI